MALLQTYLWEKNRRVQDEIARAQARSSAVHEVPFDSPVSKRAEASSHQAKIRAAGQILGMLTWIARMQGLCSAAGVYSRVFKTELILTSMMALAGCGWLLSHHSQEAAPVPAGLTAPRPLSSPPIVAERPAPQPDFTDQALKDPNLNKALNMGHRVYGKPSPDANTVTGFVSDFTKFMHGEGKNLDRQMQNDPGAP